MIIVKNIISYIKKLLYNNIYYTIYYIGYVVDIINCYTE